MYYFLKLNLVWVYVCVCVVCLCTHMCASVSMQKSEDNAGVGSILFSVTEITLADLVTGASWKREDKQNLTLKSADMVTIWGKPNQA